MALVSGAPVVLTPPEGFNRELPWIQKREATIRLRRGGDWIVKSKMEPYDGTRVRLNYGWVIDVGDSKLYAGEIAWIIAPDHQLSLPIGWIATGDLTDWTLIDG